MSIIAHSPTNGIATKPATMMNLVMRHHTTFGTNHDA
jgi:hypothetical protein